MHEWGYSKLDLNELPRKTNEIDLLNNAGAAGWEVVTITANEIAYLKRQVGRAPVRATRIKVAQLVNNGAGGK